MPEVSFKDALAAEPQLRKLYKDDVYLSNAVYYSASDEDLIALASTTQVRLMIMLIAAISISTDTNAKRRSLTILLR